MKYYVIKVTATATDDNLNFKGSVHTYYCGRNQKLLGGDDANGELKASNILSFENSPHRSWLIKEYGYKRLCDAKRSYIYKNPCNESWYHWREVCEIVEVEA